MKPKHFTDARECFDYLNSFLPNLKALAMGGNEEWFAFFDDIPTQGWYSKTWNPKRFCYSLTPSYATRTIAAMGITLTDNSKPWDQSLITAEPERIVPTDAMSRFRPWVKLEGEATLYRFYGLTPANGFIVSYGDAKGAYTRAVSRVTLATEQECKDAGVEFVPVEPVGLLEAKRLLRLVYSVQTPLNERRRAANQLAEAMGLEVRFQ